jgi:hypothetical protein
MGVTKKGGKWMKRWLYTVGFAGLIAILLIPLMGFSANAKGQTKIKPNQITLESGGVGVPLELAEELFPGLYHSPTDGIISGAYGEVGCVPDIHEFSKSNPGEHIVFTAGVEEFANNEDAAAFLEDFTIYVEITSNGQKVVELPFFYHADPQSGEGVDPNTGKPFWVSALYFSEAYPGAKVIDLPTGEYNYKFKAKANGKNGHVLDVWVPKNHKFTIVD